MTNLYDTITAISTPLGTGGVGIIRIKGINFKEIIGEKVSQNPKEKNPLSQESMRRHQGGSVRNGHPSD